MSIDFTCGNCSTTLRVPDEHLGKQARCPKCQLLCEVKPDADVTFLEPNQPASPYPGPVHPVKSTYDSGGQNYQSPYPTQHATATYSVAHRGGLILTMGIMAIACNLFLVPGILAWVMGRADLRQMKAGTMDRSGEGITQAGMIMGIIMTCLQGIGTVLYIGFIMLMIIFGIIGELA